MIGYSCFSDGGSCWRRHHGALVPLGPPHVEPSLDDRSARGLLVRSRASFVRWDESFDRLAQGEWWHVIKDEPEALDQLSRNTRSKVRRGAKVFHTVPESRAKIYEDGYSVYESAYARYRTFEKSSRSRRFVMRFWRCLRKPNSAANASRKPV